MYGVNITFSQGGLERSKVRASKVIQMRENEALTMSGGVRFIFLDTLGKRSGFMLAKSAIVDELRESFRAIGDVYVWSDESKAGLDTKTLNWNPTTRQINTPDSVRISTALDTLYGVGLVADEGLHFWEIKEPLGRSYRAMPERQPKPRNDRRVKTP